MINRITESAPARGRVRSTRAPWERVPRVNLLVRPRRKIPAHVYGYAGVAVVAVLALFFAYNAFSGYKVASDQAEQLRAQASRERAVLSRAASDVDAVKAETKELQDSREAAALPVRLAQNARLDLERALAGIYAIRVPGVSVDAITLQSQGVLQVSGTAADAGAMEQYHKLLPAASPALALRSLTWNVVSKARAEAESKPQTLVEWNASWVVRKEPRG